MGGHGSALAQGADWPLLRSTGHSAGISLAPASPLKDALDAGLYSHAYRSYAVPECERPLIHIRRQRNTFQKLGGRLARWRRDTRYAELGPSECSMAALAGMISVGHCRYNARRSGLFQEPENFFLRFARIRFVAFEEWYLEAVQQWLLGRCSVHGRR